MSDPPSSNGRAASPPGVASEAIPSPELERFAMASAYGRLTGVAVACHAIEDAFLLMHAGVGCKDKVTHLLAHDWERHCNLRQGWTEVGDESLIAGAARRIGPYVRSWQQRMGSSLICVVPASFLEMTSEDLAAEVRRADDESEASVLLVRAAGHDGDEFDGYASLCSALMESIEWRRRDGVPRQVSLLGYWFDRYEGDHFGNLSQLGAMLKALGLHLGPVLLSGARHDDLLEAGRSELLVELPYLRPARTRLEALWTAQGRRTIATDLPMGLAGTRRWLSAVAGAADVDARLATAYADKREERARAPLAKMQSRWRSTRVALFAEAPLAAGYASMLIELGVEPCLIGLRGSSLGGRDAFESVLERNGLSLPGGAVVLEASSLATLRTTLLDALSAGELDGVLGSATELNLLGHASPAELGASLATSGGARRGPFVLEIGFPCWHYHAVQQMPFMGYGGLVTFAQRLIDPPRLHDAGRSAVR